MHPHVQLVSLVSLACFSVGVSQPSDWENFNIAVKKYTQFGQKGIINLFKAGMLDLQNLKPTPGFELTCRDEADKEHDWISTKVGEKADADYVKKSIPLDNNTFSFYDGVFTDISTCDIAEMLCNTLTQPNAQLNPVLTITFENPLKSDQITKSSVILIFNIVARDMLAIVSSEPIDITTACSASPAARGNTIVCASSKTLALQAPPFNTDLSLNTSQFFRDWANFNIAVSKWTLMAKHAFSFQIINSLSAIQQNQVPACSYRQQSSARGKRSTVTYMKCIDENFKKYNWISTTHKEENDIADKFIPSGDAIFPFANGTFSEIPKHDVRNWLCNTLKQSAAQNPALMKMYKLKNLFEYKNGSNAIIFFNTETGESTFIFSEYPIEITNLCNNDSPDMLTNTIVCASFELLKTANN